ncbi:MAG: HAD family hydrolase [bacterium]|nr:HAD family hydrolase [bacterium]
MNILVSDLDNTLIYSYKKEIGTEKIVVEYYQGKELSFMTRTSHQLLNEVKEQVLVVPVSTRSVAQYERITFNEAWTPSVALVSNGGTLLRDGKEDQAWKEETMRLIAPSVNELEKAEGLLRNDENRTLEVRLVDDVFLFTKSSNPEKTVDMLEHNLDLRLVDCYSNHSKVYVLPKALTKGEAVKRLKNCYNVGQVIAAGDSIFDVSMMKQADRSFCPKELEEEFSDYKGTLRLILENEILSDIMLNEVVKL